MHTLTLGPFAFPWERLAVLVALAVVVLLARWPRRVRSAALDRALLITVGAAFVAGRVGYVALHAPAYLAAPLDVLAFWDGGLSGFAMAVVAMLAATELARRHALPAGRLMRPLLAGAAVWLAFGMAHEIADAGAERALPDATLAAVDGTAVPLAQFRGRPVVGNQWATWCPPCRHEMPMLAAAQAQHPDIHFLFVNQGEPAVVIGRYISTEALSLRNVLLDPAAALRGLGGGVLPTTLFFDADGRLVASHVGALTRARLEAYLQGLR